MNVIQIDSRESDTARKRICKQFAALGVKWFVSKMYCGDYTSPSNPQKIVERKKTIGELCANMTMQKKRFVTELNKLKTLGASMVILIEENTIDGKPITKLSDLVLWSSPHTTITGERVYRSLNSLCHRYDLDVMFCSRSETGAKIVEILFTGAEKGILHEDLSKQRENAPADNGQYGRLD